MELIHPCCAGLDVHKKTVVACCRFLGPDGKLRKQTRTFSTVTADLLALADWLLAQGVTHVAMESTGEFWKPIYAILEPLLTVLVVNAQHIKQVPGRKTDVKDAEWIAELLAHGLLRASFIPPLPQRDLRDLTRQRTVIIQERTAVVNRLQKVLEWANIKLTTVVSEVVGKSARAMLEAIVDGQSDTAALAELARGRLRSKREALEQALSGRVREHHRFMLARHLEHIDFLDEQIATFDAQIAALIEPQEPSPPSAAADDGQASGETGDDASKEGPRVSWAEAVEIWDAIPGIGRRVAEQLVAEVGTDMSQFRSAAHLASWAKLCPGNNESAGKRRSSRIGKGNRYLREALVQAAWAAVKVKDSSLAAFYRKLVTKRGPKRAIVAVAHKLLVIVYTLLKTGELYQERGAAAVDERQKDRLLARMRQRIEQLGYIVSLEPKLAAAA